MPGLLAQKLGMTRIFLPEGEAIPVTVLRAGPCVLVMKKEGPQNKYMAVQLGHVEILPGKINKVRTSHFSKKNLKPLRYLKEFRTNHLDFYGVGDVLDADDFKVGEKVDVVGRSKGKGFQGVMKRYHFAGGHASHGCSLAHRAPGSTGQRTWPGKVIKGKRMPGHMGHLTVTMKNLEIVGIKKESHILLIKGAIPGASHSMVALYPTDENFEKRIAERKIQKAS